MILHLLVGTLLPGNARATETGSIRRQILDVRVRLMLADRP